MDLETTLRACLSGDKAVRDAAEAAIAQLQKQRQSPLQLFQVMQASQHEEVSLSSCHTPKTVTQESCSDETPLARSACDSRQECSMVIQPSWVLW